MINLLPNFDFNTYKNELYNKVLEKNKKMIVFSDMMTSYQELYFKNKKLIEKNDYLERENFSLKKFTGYINI